MRRRRAKAGGENRRRALLAVCAAAVLAAWVWYEAEKIEDSLWPAMREAALHECRTAVVRCINRAVCAELNRAPDAYGSLYTAEGGAVRGDTARLNAAQTALVAAAQDAVDAMPEDAVTVPVGSLSGSIFLFELGPGWTVRMHPTGYVEGEITETAQAVSINRTRFTAVLVLRTIVSVLLDGRTEQTAAEQRIPLASFLLDGEVPTYYGGS